MVESLSKVAPKKENDEEEITASFLADKKINYLTEAVVLDHFKHFIIEKNENYESK